MRACSYTQTDSFKASAYYDEFVRPQGWVNLVATGLMRTPDAFALLALTRAPDARWLEPAEWHLLETLTPHLQRAVALQSLLAHSRATANALAAAAKNNFDARSKSIEQFGANLSLLDREIQYFNPQIAGLEEQLRQYTAQKSLLIWPQPKANSRGADDDPQDLQSLEDIVQKIREFAPTNEAQRFVQASALKIAGDLTETRWTLAVQEGREIPRAFIYLVVYWLTLLFIHYGIFAQRNALVTGAVFVCALSLASAIYIIEDLNEPAGGLISVSPKPMQDALAQMSR